MKTPFGWMLLGLAVAGCSVPQVTLQPGTKAKNGSTPPRESKESDDDATAEDDLSSTPQRDENGEETGANVLYTASIEKMENHTFGHRSPDGKASCYFTFFSDVEVRATVNRAGRLVSATFTGTSNEFQNVTSCNVAPMQPSRHTYTFAEGGTSETASLEPAPENLPQATLTAEIAVESSRLTLHWHRVDVNQPWDWEFTEQIALTKSGETAK